VETEVWGFEIVSVFQIAEHEFTLRSREGFGVALYGIVWSLEVNHLDIESLQVHNGKNSRLRN